MKIKCLGFPIFLMLYHLAFTCISWLYIQQNMGDAHLYWHLEKSWGDYLGVGPEIIRLINYPLSNILQLPFWSGFLLYSLIGIYPIILLYQFALDYISPSISWKKYFLMFVFLLPNLHFWTSMLGKEPVVFLAIVWIIINQIKCKYLHFQYLFGWILLILIRPHVAMFLLLAVSFSFLVRDKGFSMKKVMIIITTFIFSLGLYLMTMYLLHRNPFDLQLILERNDASLIAFRRADSYIPMIDYNMFERFFALNFRPLFFDSESLYSFVLSVENFFVIIILFLALARYSLNFRLIKVDIFGKIACSFFVISSLFFIQRYSCLGIFVRTKIMYMPFLLIAALQIITQIKTPPRDGV